MTPLLPRPEKVIDDFEANTSSKITNSLFAKTTVKTSHVSNYVYQVQALKKHLATLLLFSSLYAEEQVSPYSKWWWWRKTLNTSGKNTGKTVEGHIQEKTFNYRYYNFFSSLRILK